MRGDGLDDFLHRHNRADRHIRMDERRYVGTFNMDVAESVHFSRSLEQVQTKVYETRYPGFKWQDFIPLAQGVDPNASVLTWTRYDQVGLAKIIVGYSRDIPRVDIFGVQESMTVRNMADAYGYNIFEVNACLQDGVPLEQRRANAARRAQEQLVETIAFSGDATHNLLGLSNQPNATVYSVPVGASSLADWADKTPDEILTDLYAIGDLILSTTRQTERPDTLLIPQIQYGLISRTRLDVYNPESILEHFIKTSAHIKNVDVWDLLKGAGAGGTDRMVAYRRDPEALEMVRPVPFTQEPAQPQGLEVEINCWSRVGGVRVYLPLSMAYGDGI